MTRILAIRPEPGLSATLKLGRELGLDIHGSPLFEIRPIAWDASDPDGFDGLLIGSANAILHGGVSLDLFKNKPVFAVGATTAKAAEKAGFRVANVGSGGLQSVLDDMDGPARLLRISGAEHVALRVPEGITLETVIAYESAPLSLPDQTAQWLEKPAIVLLHSAAAARHFTQECDRLDIDKARISLAALGPRIVEGLTQDWHSIHISPAPRDTDLLEIIAKLCV